MEITIDAEFSNLCRPLTAEEKTQLEANLHLDGCRDPLVVWGNTLLDGHNRYEICTRTGLSYRTAQAPNIRERGDAINWIIANQLGRRNLIPEDVSYLRGKRYEAEKLSPEENKARWQAAGTVAALQARGHTNDRQAVQNEQAGETRARLGKEFGVGQSTIQRDAAFAVAVDQIHDKLGKATADLIRTGKSGLPKTAIVAFAKEDDMTLEKFNDLRFEHQQRRAAQQKERKKSAPKPPSLTAHKSSEIHRDVIKVERMRPFMNAVIQIATSPVTAKTLAAYKWPDTWRKQMDESLPLAIAYLNAFVESFETQSQEATNGQQAEARSQDAASA